MHTSAKELDAIESRGASAADGRASGRSLAGCSRAGWIWTANRSRPRRVAARCDGGLDALADGERSQLACLVHPLRDKPATPAASLMLRLRADLQMEHSELIGKARRSRAKAWRSQRSAAAESSWRGTTVHRSCTRVVDVARAARRAARGVRGRTRGRGAFDGGARRPQCAGGRRPGWSAANCTADRGQRARGTTRRCRSTARRCNAAVVRARVGPGARISRPAAGQQDRAVSGARGGAGQLNPARRHVSAVPTVWAAPRSRRAWRVVAATPRTYGGDYFVGVNWLDSSLQRVARRAAVLSRFACLHASCA